MPAVLNHRMILKKVFTCSEVSVSSSIVTCIIYIVDTYVVPSSVVSVVSTLALFNPHNKPGREVFLFSFYR